MMKKISYVILTICCILSTIYPLSFASEKPLHFGAYNLSGERKCIVNVYLDKLIINDENSSSGLEQYETDTNIVISEKIISVAEEGDNFVYMDMRIDNAENPYPEIEPTFATVMLSQGTGNVRSLIGKDYRLYYAENADAELVDISDKITDTSEARPKFDLEKLGVYVLCFNPKVYNVTFYLEEPIYEEENWVNQDCIYEQITDLEYNAIIEFPELPEKEGYVFTGWKAQHFVGGGGGTSIKYTMPQPIKVSAHREFFATWCLKDEYEPVNIEITSSEPITKGKENGKIIIVKTNYGWFVDDDDFPEEWRTEYESETDEAVKQSIIAEWKSKWNIIGNDEIMIETAKRIDDKTVELILSGNSSDKYSNSDIYVEFDSSLLRSEPYETDGELLFPPDSKIKTDKEGIRGKMYCSDNAIEISKQKRPSSSGGTIRYKVSFNSNGGSEISTKYVSRNSRVKEPENPIRDGFDFVGWFSDKEMTKKYDFSSRINGNCVLYAKWSERNVYEKQIVFTVGEKTVSVFGKNVLNDVAPLLIQGEPVLPIRFIAECLGAEVVWNEKDSSVSIYYAGKESKLYVGDSFAVVNGTERALTIPAFIEKGRTYVSSGILCEIFEADITLSENDRVTVTK